MKRIISYIFTVPACVLFLIAELVRGEKITWRAEETINHWLAGKPNNRCTKCGHKGKLHLDKK
jgi:hypothetical protein